MLLILTLKSSERIRFFFFLVLARLPQTGKTAGRDLSPMSDVQRVVPPGVHEYQSGCYG